MHGDASADADFEAGSDRVRYSIDVAGGTAPFTVEAELWYQSIAYRWAQNLKQYHRRRTHALRALLRTDGSGIGADAHEHHGGGASLIGHAAPRRRPNTQDTRMSTARHSPEVHP